MEEINELYDYISQWYEDDMNNEDYEFKQLTTLTYLHPFFTYHAEPPKYYLKHYDSSKISVYSISISTFEAKDGSGGKYPNTFNEDLIQEHFCFYVRELRITDITAFLGWQFNIYINRPVIKKDPSAFLDYVILTIQKHRHWSVYDFEKLIVVARWIRSHPGFIEAFDQRLKNWINLNSDFQSIIESQKEITKSEQINAPSISDAIYLQKPEQVVLALYYYYLQEARILKRFDLHPGGKLKAIKEVAVRHNVSWKGFQQKYNRIDRDSEYRISKANHANIKKVIPLISKYPLALEIAKKELKKSEFR